jgi:hypothetical protein
MHYFRDLIRSYSKLFIPSLNFFKKYNRHLICYTNIYKFSFKWLFDFHFYFSFPMKLIRSILQELLLFLFLHAIIELFLPWETLSSGVPTVGPTIPSSLFLYHCYQVCCYCDRLPAPSPLKTKDIIYLLSKKYIIYAMQNLGNHMMMPLFTLKIYPWVLCHWLKYTSTIVFETLLPNRISPLSPLHCIVNFSSPTSFEKKYTCKNRSIPHRIYSKIRNGFMLPVY